METGVTLFLEEKFQRGAGANDPAFSVDLTSSMAIFRRTEILQIIHGNCYTSQGGPDSSFPLWPPWSSKMTESMYKYLQTHWPIEVLKLCIIKSANK